MSKPGANITHPQLVEAIARAFVTSRADVFGHEADELWRMLSAAPESLMADIRAAESVISLLKKLGFPVPPRNKDMHPLTQKARREAISRAKLRMSSARRKEISRIGGYRRWGKSPVDSL